MRCPKCGNNININMTNCPVCGNNVSFSNKKVIPNLVINIPKILSFIIIVPFIYMGGCIGIGALKVTGNAVMSDKILDIIFYVGIILVVINILIVIKNKAEQLNQSHNQRLVPTRKPFKISITWFAMGIIFLTLPFVVKPIIKTVLNLDFIDYETAQYIEVSNVKIPTLYSTVGKRDITFNLGSGNQYNEEFNISFSTFIIIYDNITETDITLYKEELLNQNYTLIKLSDEEDDEEMYLYVKNEKDLNKFILINIAESSITYSVAAGTYEEKLKGYMEV